jgi:hypothetical protein
MKSDADSKPTFYAGRRWMMWFNVIISVVAALGLMVMANYLAAGYYKRLSVSSDTRLKLSPQTVKLLKTITNEVEVTIFFDVHGEEQLYTWTATLLKEYSHLNPKIRVRTLDYTRFNAEAALALAKYKLELKDKDFIAFESNGHTEVVFKSQLAELDLEPLIRRETTEARRKAFLGEMHFSAALLSLAYPRVIKAYFLEGHNEQDPASSSELGYQKFAGILKQENNVAWDKLLLRGTNAVPADCHLLIIAGPRSGHFSEQELATLDAFLGRGGRLLVLMNNWFFGGHTGLEKLLEKWGVAVGDNIVFDKENSVSGNDLVPAQINPEHPVTKALFQEKLQVELVLPRSVDHPADTRATSHARKVDVLVAQCQKLQGDAGHLRIGRRGGAGRHCRCVGGSRHDPSAGDWRRVLFQQSTPGRGGQPSLRQFGHQVVARPAGDVARWHWTPADD